MHARHSPFSPTFQLAFDNRQACQIIAAFAVAINGFDALSCDAHVYALKALVMLLTPRACSAS